MRSRFGSIGLPLVLLLLILGSFAVGQASDDMLPGNGAPTVVSYQGLIKEGGAPYTGTGYFKFAVVNAAGSTSFWSNDATSSGGDEPSAGVQLSVSQGLFNVLLGDTGLANMTSLPASVFGDVDRYLRVWFSTDGSSYTQLSPDQRIAAAPYAMQAEEALTAGNADTLDGMHASDFAGEVGIGEVLSVGESIDLVSVSGLTFTFTCSDPSGVGDQVLGEVTVTSGADGTEGVLRDLTTYAALQGWKVSWANELNNGSSALVLSWRAEQGQTPGQPSERGRALWFASTLGGSVDGVLTAHVGAPFWDECALSGHLVAGDAGP
jgi:hypothetical protein